MMKRQILSSLALSALVMAMSATSANAAIFPVLDAKADQFRAKVATFFNKRENGQIKVYAVSQGKGKFGEILAQKGWKLDYTTNFASIPNNPSTIVYVNVADPQIKWAELANFFANFDGVIVVDSNQTAELVQTMNPDGVLTARYVYKGQGEKFGLGYRKLFAKSTRISGYHVPNGTAAIVSMRVKNVMPLNIEANQTINGIPTADLDDAVNLKHAVYTNKTESVPSSTAKSATGGAIPVFDQTHAITTVSSGVWTVAKVYIKATKGSRFWNTDTFVRTGDIGTGPLICQNGPIRCGIYFSKSDGDIVNVENTAAGTKITGYFTGYRIEVDSLQARALKNYAPLTAFWETPGSGLVVADDKTDITFKVGSTLSNTPNFTSPQTVFKYNDELYIARQAYPSWKVWTYGYKEQGNDGEAGPAYIGAEMRYQNKKETNGFLVLPGENILNAYLKKMLSGESETKAGGKYTCGGTTGLQTQVLMATVPKKSSMTWGWQPNIVASHESSYQPVTTSPIGTISVKMEWTRVTPTYTKTTIVCKELIKRPGTIPSTRDVNVTAYLRDPSKGYNAIVEYLSGNDTAKFSNVSEFSVYSEAL